MAQMFALMAALMLNTAICTKVTGGIPHAGINLVLSSKEWVEPEEEDVVYMAKTIFGEANGCLDLDKSAVAWCICNRVDSSSYPDTVKDVVTQYKQFHGYNDNMHYTDDEYRIAYEVLFDWLNNIELRRTLPMKYLYFHAERGRNVFTTDYRQGQIWDWSLPYRY